jgi:hypothetical protein
MLAKPAFANIVESLQAYDKAVYDVSSSRGVWMRVHCCWSFLAAAGTMLIRRSSFLVALSGLYMKLGRILRFDRL